VGTSSGVISGSGLAMAKMIGFFAIDLTMSAVKAPFADRPKNDVGALHRLGQRARLGVTGMADFHWFMPSVRPL
jgi:hypothetical protein